MTVKELIEQLKKQDPNAIVFKAGYEGGYNYVGNELVKKDMVLFVHEEWYYGSHDIFNKEDSDEYSDKKIVKGVIL